MPPHCGKCWKGALAAAAIMLVWLTMMMIWGRPLIHPMLAEVQMDWKNQ